VSPADAQVVTVIQHHVNEIAEPGDEVITSGWVWLRRAFPEQTDSWCQRKRTMAFAWLEKEGYGERRGDGIRGKWKRLR
jgi:hypothetical protein